MSARRAQRLRYAFCNASVVGFVALYAIAARLYPGGTHADPARSGFSFAGNYWCDVLDATTYGGWPNPGRPVALAATVLLCAGLAVLWWSLPASFGFERLATWIVRAAGVASGLLVPLVATPWHDRVIDAACALGALAFLVTLGASWSRSGVGLRWTALTALALAAVNYAIWVSRAGLSALPLLQKGAFAAFLLWVLLAARSAARARRIPA